MWNKEMRPVCIAPTFSIPPSPNVPVKILFLLYVKWEGGNCAARFIMSLTVRCEGSLYIMCSM